MVKSGILERVTGPSKWLSPIVVAWRKNGNVRLCGDFRRLNEAIQRERYAIPSADSFFAKMSGAKYFSCLDLESGFHQIKLDAESSELTTISTHCGNYRFKRLPFGVSSAPELFQRVMSDHLIDLPGCLVYIDDIIVFGKDQAEHDARLAAVLQRLQSIEAKLNKKKV